MHSSSFENMQWCYRRYAAPRIFEGTSPVSVLDVGGANVNGSYSDIFKHKNVRFLGMDLQEGPGIDIVLEDPYKFPLEDQSIDFVISGQMLEHCEFFWQTFSEMVRVVKPDGYIFLIAPSGGPIHQYPVDCYRFYPDAYRALAKLTGCHLIDLRHDERGPWRDLVGVFSRVEQPAAVPHPNTYHPPVSFSYKTVLELEPAPHRRPYLEVLEDLHRALQPKGYLEIGVRGGHSLALARSPAVGVDPDARLAVSLPDTTHIAPLISDDFFEYGHEVIRDLKPDFVFIDGMHLFEFVMRDFMNVERLVGPDTIVVIDDILPNHPAQAQRQCETYHWMGDVWRFLIALQQFRPDLAYCLLDTEPSGLLIIAGLDANNRVFGEQYNNLAWLAQNQPRHPPEGILKRHTAMPAHGEHYEQMLELLKAFRAMAGRTPHAAPALRQELDRLAIACQPAR